MEEVIILITIFIFSIIIYNAFHPYIKIMEGYTDEEVRENKDWKDMKGRAVSDD